ncbi:50S ribosomal protein L21e [Candidatus Woesearchaeota archaeon]|jgi:large subunit ribosomal protein L21e|nr:50S ribosomal protein L21e [Candidatus Woesearchaeota archaeon]MBT6044525.1 50S ribosomal protein L21e [Candidatus Woesearchaeota archaeon]
MATRVGGFRRKTRSKLRKSPKEKGKISIRKYFQELKAGNKVCFKAEPAVQKGMYFPRFHGKTGEVIEKNGSCYKVKFKDGNKQKIIIAHPVHLKKL